MTSFGRVSSTDYADDTDFFEKNGPDTSKKELV